MRVGLDIGSTTIKCVVLNDAEQIVYSTYERPAAPGGNHNTAGRTRFRCGRTHAGTCHSC